MKLAGRNLRAVSPVLAVLMMIAVAIAGSLVVYAWVMGYIYLSTEKSGEAIIVPSIANYGTDLIVYVQNVGEDVVQLDERSCLYVNGELVTCTIYGVTTSNHIATLEQGKTATLKYINGAALPGEKVEIKVTTTLGAFSEYSDYLAGSSRASPVLDHFEFDTIESPQTSGVPFTVTIRAIDQYGKLFTGYEDANVIYSSGPMMTLGPGMDESSIRGVLTLNVTFTGSANDVTIGTAALSDPSKNGTSNTFEVVGVSPPTQVLLFEDDFEDYPVGTFPSSGGWQLWYDGMGTQYQVIVNTASNSPTKSLNLLGVSGWAAFAAKPIDTDSPLIGFTVSVRVESLGGGDRDNARVGFAENLPPTRATTYAPILFTDKGTIKVMGEGDLLSYVAGRWYKVTVILDRNAETYSLWIDDELVGEDLPVYTNRGPLEAGETSWDMEAFSVSQCYYSTNAYFDDVHVFYIS